MQKDPTESWSKEFDEKFPECDCTHGDHGSHFEDPKVDRIEVKSFISSLLETTRKEAVMDIRQAVANEAMIAGDQYISIEFLQHVLKDITN